MLGSGGFLTRLLGKKNQFAGINFCKTDRPGFTVELKLMSKLY